MVLIKNQLKKLKPKLYLLVSRYFIFWARLSLRRWQPTIICVTGSVGKTTMLHLLEAQLGNKAHYSHNANSVYGVTADIVNEKGVTGSRLHWLWLLVAMPIKGLVYKRAQEYYVVEVDADRPDEAAQLASLLRPKFTFWVSLSESHAVNFEGLMDKLGAGNHLEAIAHEFARIGEFTTDKLYMDGANKKMLSATNSLSVAVVPIMLDDKIDYQIGLNQTLIGVDGFEFVFSDPQPRELALQLKFVVELLTDLDLEIKTDLTNVTWPPSRSTLLKGHKGTYILDSSYNAHLQSMQAVLDMAKMIKHKPTWLIIGDIIEQGKLEAKAHQKLAEMIIKTHADKVILVGPRTHKHTYSAIGNNIDTVSFIEPKLALEYLRDNISGGELLVFKGSQYLEGIVEPLLADPADANKLCRRGKAASARRRAKGL